MNPPEGRVPPRAAIRSLVCRRDVDLSARCLGSLVRYSADPVRFVLHEDGSLDDASRDVLRRELGDVEFVPRAAADAAMAERLARHPACAAFRARTLWGLKLLDIALLQEDDTFYVDGDVRFFRPFGGLFRKEALAAGPIFFHDHHWQAYSLRPWHLLNPRLAVAASVNTGLTLISRSDYDLDFIEWFLARHAYPVVSAWIEPTVWAALAWRRRGRTLDPGQFPQLYPDRVLGDATIGAHFLSAYRSRFADALQNGLGDTTACEPLPIRTLPVRRLGPLGLGISQLRRACENRASLRKLTPGSTIGRHPNQDV